MESEEPSANGVSQGIAIEAGPAGLIIHNIVACMGLTEFAGEDGGERVDDELEFIGLVSVHSGVIHLSNLFSEVVEHFPENGPPFGRIKMRALGSSHKKRDMYSLFCTTSTAH